VLPFLALGEELLRRSHEVVVLTGSYFEKAVCSLGLKFAAIASVDEYLTFTNHPDAWDRNKGSALVWNALTGVTPRIVEAVRTHAGPSTVLLANRSTVGGFVARELCGLPMVSVALNPYLVRSLYSPPDYGFLTIPAWTGRLGAQVLFKLVDAKFRKDFVPPLNRVRKQFGLAPIRDLTAYAADVEAIACAWSECLYGKQPDWPRQAETVGFLFFDHHEAGEEIAPVNTRTSKKPSSSRWVRVSVMRTNFSRLP
jgi:UDP:flavonoid glycosyltransferase YjiC (YdhE family)